MKIGIDARWIFHDISGIGAYTRELIRQLARLDEVNQYRLFFNDPGLMHREAEAAGFAGKSNFKTCLVPWGLFAPAAQWDMPRRLRALDIDVFHAPNYMIPFMAFARDRPGRIRCVVTLHDLIPLMFPEFTPRSRKRRLFFLYRWLMREVARRADTLIAVSRASQRDIRRVLLTDMPRPPATTVIYQGVAPVFGPPAARPARQRDEPRVIFWVGRHDPYKNLAGLLRAVALLARQAPFPVRLHLGGAEDARYPEAARLTGELGLQDVVHRLGYLDDTRLLAEYQQADVFVMPSLYEGFGLPVLEAMACGTPVVCADCASLPEVVGDAALTVPPADAAALADAMLRVLTDRGLAQRMSERGRERAARFSWETTARHTMEVYRELGA